MARRAAKRRPLIEVVRPWIVTLNARGAWVIVDEDGNNPLTHPDPVVRLFNVHLAARAPTLKEALAKLAKRFEWFESPYGRDEQVLRIAFGEVFACQPSLKDLEEAQDRRGQQEIDLAA